MGLFRRSKNTKLPVIRQLLDLIPTWLFQSCVQKYKSDKYTHKYKTYDQLVALSFGQLNKCEFKRYIEWNRDKQKIHRRP